MSETFTIFKEITCTNTATNYTELVYTAPARSAVIVDIRIWAEPTNKIPVSVSLWTNKQTSTSFYMPGMECYGYPLQPTDALRIDRFVLASGDRLYVNANNVIEEATPPKIAIQVRGIL